MTGLAELLAECDALGIRLLPAGDGGLTIDAPPDALTRELVERLKTSKADVLSLFGASVVRAADPLDASAIWSKALDNLAANPKSGFALEEIAILRTVEVRWVPDDAKAAIGPTIDFEELPDWPAPPCPNCGSLELWQDLADRWRCRHCDPPTTSRRFQQHAERIKRKHSGKRPGSYEAKRSE